jgi:glutathione S-transferase
MKVYYHPVSTTSRPIMLFAAEHDLDIEFKVVDLFTGEHLQPAYATVNPNCLVPVLEDGDFRLTESSSILKYLAEKVASPTYPTELRKRARVNERMDWLNTGFYRDLGYGLVYPQVFPSQRRADPSLQAGTLEWGRDKAKAWLKILDQSWIGPKSRYLCGDDITIADYFGSAMVTVGEVIHLDYSAYPNINRWIATMEARPSWAKVHEAFYAHFVAPFKEASFVGL